MRYSYNLKIFFLILISLIINSNIVQASYLASIPPLHSILSGILKDIDNAEVDVLLDGQISPHTFALKPSHIKKIRGAKVIFWIGPSYETFLIKPLKTFAAVNVKIIEIPGLIVWPLRVGGDWQHDSCQHDHSSDTTDAAHSALSLADPHVWLDVNNANKIAEYFYHYFVKIYPNQQHILQHNFERTRRSFNQLNGHLTAELKDFTQHTFLVHHDGYQYFEKAYHLAGTGVVMNHPERTPSVHYVKNLLDIARSKQVRCIFSEHQFSSRFVDELVRTLNAHTAILDPFGHNNNHDERDYITMMKNITHNFIQCFKE